MFDETGKLRCDPVDFFIYNSFGTGVMKGLQLNFVKTDRISYSYKRRISIILIFISLPFEESALLKSWDTWVTPVMLRRSSAREEKGGRISHPGEGYSVPDVT